MYTRRHIYYTHNYIRIYIYCDAYVLTIGRQMGRQMGRQIADRWMDGQTDILDKWLDGYTDR